VEKIVLRPRPALLRQLAIRGGVPAIALGGGAIYLSDRNLIVRGTGVVFIVIIVFMLLNKMITRVRFEDGTLRMANLVERHSVDVSDIVEVVPVALKTTYGLGVRRHESTGMYFDVRDAPGSTGIWLNPNVYGASNVEALLRAIGQVPSRTIVQHTVDF
jgi:hypothetical protein